MTDESRFKTRNNPRFTARPRDHIDNLLAEFFAAGGKVQKVAPRNRTFTEYDWFRLERGLKPETVVESVDIQETDDAGARHYAA